MVCDRRNMRGQFKQRVIFTVLVVMCFLAWKISRNQAGPIDDIVELKDVHSNTVDGSIPAVKHCEIPDDDYLIEIQRMNEERVAADDACLVDLIRKYYIVPPSLLPYNLTSPENPDTSVGQAAFVDSQLNHKMRGFYIESGAFDGEYISNTLFFERTRGWMGVLIEPNPTNFKALLGKHRKAFSINACLSTQAYPTEVLIDDKGELSMINQVRKTGKQTIRVQCFPIYSIMLALNRTNVDYFSLDVEGAEKGVLDNIPWDKVNIDLMSIEFNKYPGLKDGLGKDMKLRGYDWLTTIKRKLVEDIIGTVFAYQWVFCSSAVSHESHEMGSIHFYYETEQHYFIAVTDNTCFMVKLTHLEQDHVHTNSGIEDIELTMMRSWLGVLPEIRIYHDDKNLPSYVQRYCAHKDIFLLDRPMNSTVATATLSPI